MNACTYMYIPIHFLKIQRIFGSDFRKNSNYCAENDHFDFLRATGGNYMWEARKIGMNTEL